MLNETPAQSRESLANKNLRQFTPLYNISVMRISDIKVPRFNLFYGGFVISLLAIYWSGSQYNEFHIEKWVIIFKFIVIMN